MTGIRTEVKIPPPTNCPIVHVSNTAGGASSSISRSLDPTSSGTITEEFTLDADKAIGDRDTDPAIHEVFSYGETRIYRFTRSQGRDCPCECVEQFSCPVVDVYTQDGALHLLFHTSSIETLQEVIATLRKQYPQLEIQRLLRSEGEQSETDLVCFDRGTLTDRQREILETAHQMGYFDHPRQANAGEVAEALDITTGTFTEHLTAAQTKLLNAILEM